MFVKEKYIDLEKVINIFWNEDVIFFVVNFLLILEKGIYISKCLDINFIFFILM